MIIVCNECNGTIEEDQSYYCFTCDNFICKSCYDNHLFQGEDIHRMCRIEDVQYKVIKHTKLKGYCKVCDEIFDLKNYYPKHYKHAFDLIELNPKNNKKKKIQISERACGPEIEIMTFSKKDFLSNFNHSKNALAKINSHEPIFLLSHTSIKTIDECDYIDYMDQLYVLNDENQMIEISFFGLYEHIGDDTF